MDVVTRSKFAPSIEMQEGSPYLGKAGEHLVLAHLLLRRFDAALVAVDTGTDVLAEKKDKLFRFQVKSRSMRGKKKDRALFVVSEKAVARKLQPHFYVVVLVHSDEKITYLIFPSAEVEAMIKDGRLDLRKKQKRYHGNLINKGHQWFVKNLQHDITKYVDAWDLIK